MAGESREERLAHFAQWCAAHITGDERGEAQLFLDRLFQAFGQKGSLEVGGSPEMRIKKSTDDGGGTSFADYVWKPVVLIEMKKRGVDLRSATVRFATSVLEKMATTTMGDFARTWAYPTRMPPRLPLFMDGGANRIFRSPPVPRSTGHYGSPDPIATSSASRSDSIKRSRFYSRTNPGE